MRVRRLSLASFASLSLAASALALLATPAHAAVIHEYLPAPSKAIGEGVPAGCGKGEPSPPCIAGRLSGLEGMAVTPAAGGEPAHLLVAEHIAGTEEKSRLDTFNASSGAFESQLATAVGVAGHSGELVDLGAGGLAVGHPSADIYVGAQTRSSSGENPGAVAVFSAAGALLARWTGAAAPGGPFGSVAAVAVDNAPSFGDSARGDVYVAEPAEGAGGRHVVDVLGPALAPAYKEEVVGQLTGTCEHAGEVAAGAGACAVLAFSEPHAVAVDQANGVVLVADGHAVDLFAPGSVPGEYLFEGQITGTPTEPFPGTIASLAVDGESAGEASVYVSEAGGTAVEEFELLGAGGESSQYAGRLIGTAEGASFEHVVSLAVDPEDGGVYVGDRELEGPVIDVFGANIDVPAVKSAAASEVGPRAATLNATVNTEERGEASCRFIWGASPTQLTHSQACAHTVPTGPAPVPVEARLEGLQPDTTYYYRLQATSLATGQTNPGEPSEEESFTTLGPGMQASVSEVASSSATLEGSVDPRGAPTSAYFEYGRCAPASACPAGEFEDAVPAAPGQALGAGGEAAELAPQHVQGLAPGSVYHYRVVALSTLAGESEAEQFDGAEATFTTQGAGSFVLPDGRRWEMVSPARKRGAYIEPLFNPHVIQAAASGNAFTYVADTPTEAGAAGSAHSVQVLSRRGATGWESQDISTPHAQATPNGSGNGQEYRFFSEDLSSAIVHPYGVLAPGLSEEATEQTAFLRSDFPAGDVGSPCASACYHPLVSPADDTTGVPFGEEHECDQQSENPAQLCGPEFLGASPDAKHVLLYSRVALTSASSPQGGIYEWSAGVPASEQLRLVSVQPPEEGRPQRPEPRGELGFHNESARGAISADGSRVIWASEAAEDHHLYLTDTSTAQTIRLDTVQEGASGSGSSEGIAFQLASSTGSRVLFTDEQRLTRGSGAVEGNPDLYECAVSEAHGELACDLSDLTPRNGQEPADVLKGAVTGSSEDGSWVYFLANGILQSSGEDVAGAVRGNCGAGNKTEQAQRCNLYVRHDGTTRLVAVLSGADSPDWAGAAGKIELRKLLARVSPDGRWLAFMSDLPLTGYDNRDASSAKPGEEVYLYDAGSGGGGSLTCASCVPSGARPTGVEYGEGGANIPLDGGKEAWEPSAWLAADLPGWTQYRQPGARYQPRYLSNEGRLFFDSAGALVPLDENTAWDVYEYEPAGAGPQAPRCGPGVASGGEVFREARGYTVEGRSGEEGAGCVSLISSGTSDENSAFLDASESGGDVFFLTSAKLAPQDDDTALDVYDAHECSSEAPCLQPASAAPPPCETESSCKASPSPQPEIYSAPASATFSGPGNPTPTTTAARKHKTPAEERAKMLKKALKACHHDRARAKRMKCEKLARRRYGAKPKASAKKSSRHREAKR